MPIAFTWENILFLFFFGIIEILQKPTDPASDSMEHAVSDLASEQP